MYVDIFEDDVSLHDGVPKGYAHLRNKVFNDWEIPPWELKIFKDKKLGEGSWATVYLAKWKETYVVAKIMKDTEKRYLSTREIDNMTKMHHPNIVQLFGYVQDPFIIVMEYFPNKDLSYHKHMRRDRKKLIAMDILKGLNYMHTRKPDTLIHRDIKSTNIMLTNSKTAKIVDFGLSKLSETDLFFSSHPENLNNLEHQDEHTTRVGTSRYMAPEVVGTRYTTKVDIYSTGILLYELFENKIYNINKSFKFYWTPRTLRPLIELMTHIDPDKRPTARDCLKYFY